MVQVQIEWVAGARTKTCLRKYGDFSGRATRAEYWWWVLAMEDYEEYHDDDDGDDDEE